MRRSHLFFLLLAACAPDEPMPLSDSLGTISGDADTGETGDGDGEGLGDGDGDGDGDRDGARHGDGDTGTGDSDGDGDTGMGTATGTARPGMGMGDGIGDGDGDEPKMQIRARVNNLLIDKAGALSLTGRQHVRAKSGPRGPLDVGIGTWHMCGLRERRHHRLGRQQLRQGNVPGAPTKRSTAALVSRARSGKTMRLRAGAPASD
jgi:hypothetical protein